MTALNLPKGNHVIPSREIKLTEGNDWLNYFPHTFPQNAHDRLGERGNHQGMFITGRNIRGPAQCSETDEERRLEAARGGRARERERRTRASDRPRVLRCSTRISARPLSVILPVSWILPQVSYFRIYTGELVVVVVSLFDVVVSSRWSEMMWCYECGVMTVVMRDVCTVW